MIFQGDRMYEHEVIVVGGGPAGSYCAKKLAERGINTVVLEKDTFCGEKNVCGGNLNVEAVKKFGVEFATEKRILKSRFYYEKYFLDIQSARSYSFQRCNFDRLLSHRAAEAGADILLNHVMLDFFITSEKVKVKVKDLQTKKIKFITGKVIVGADGFASRVRDKINSRKFSKKDYAVAVQYQIPYSAINDINIDLDVNHFILDYSHKFGYAWIFPKKELITVGIACYALNLDFDIKRELHHLTFEHRLMKNQNINTEKIFYESSLIPVKIPENLIADRVVLIGDAAGLVKPISGGGLEYALGSAIEAANVISKVFEEKSIPDKNHLQKYLKSINYITKKINRERKFLGLLKRVDIEKLFKIIVRNKYSKTMKFLFTGEKRILIELSKELLPLMYEYKMGCK